jgi:hypothetical protein
MADTGRFGASHVSKEPAEFADSGLSATIDP